MSLSLISIHERSLLCMLPLLGRLMYCHSFTYHQAPVMEWEGASLLLVGIESFLELFHFDDLQKGPWSGVTDGNTS